MSSSALGEAMALGAATSWAAAVVLFRRSGETMPPLALNLFKNVVAAALLGVTIAPADWRAAAGVPPATVGLLALSGLLGIALSDTLFFWSLERLGAGLSALVGTTYAPILVALSAAFLGERLDLLDGLGAVLIVGALVLVSLPGRGLAFSGSRRDLVLGVLAGVLAMLVMGVGVVIIKRPLEHLPLLWATWVRVVAGLGGVVAVIALRRDRGRLLASLRPARSWRVAVPGALLGGYVSMVLWMGGMKFTLVSRAALLNQMSTILVFAFATVFLREPLTWRRGTAIALATAGAVLVIA